jgi:exonuclease SbcC
MCENHTFYRQSRINKYIDKKLGDSELIYFTVSQSHFLSELDEIKSKRKKVSLYLETIKVLEAFKIRGEIKDFEKFKKSISAVEDINFNPLIREIDKLTKLKATNNDLIQESQEIKIARDSLEKHILKHKLKDCLLCNTPFENIEILLMALNDKTAQIEKKRNDREREALSLISSIENELIGPLLLQAKKLLDDIYNDIPATFFETFMPTQQIIDKYEALAKTLSGFDFSLADFINKSKFSSEAKIEEYIEKLKLKLISLKSSCPERFYDDLYDRVYENIFDKKYPIIKSMSPESFENKISYIENQIHIQQNNKITELKLKIERCNKFITLSSNHIETLENAAPIYRKVITEFKNQIINMVQIPFYIFSGRIIQSFNKGAGFILKTSEDGSRDLKFIPNPAAEHDAVFSLSSGQLSALVISFMLALNKVYATNNLIFIDDPVQSMDDINSSSFIELLRNDFKDCFVVLSTHEDHISHYMNYKFNLAGLKVFRHNLKDD